MWHVDAVHGDVRQRRRRGGRARGASSKATPNLLSLRPVAMYGCVFGSTSGFTRKLTGARLPCAPATASRRVELARRLDVEAEDAGGERLRPSRASVLPTPENTTLRGIAAGGDHARELAAGDDVEAAAEAREEVEDREVRVRLDRVADEVRHARERRRRTSRIRAFERRARVDVAGRAEALGDRRQRHAFGVQLAVAIGERASLASRFARRLRRSFGRRADRAGAADGGRGVDAAASPARRRGSCSGPLTPQAAARAVP